MKMTIEKLRKHLQTEITITNLGGDTEYAHKEPAAWINCEDGAKLSVQAGEFLYCSPREIKADWTSVEVGYPTVSPPESWNEYGDSDDSIFGYVPIEMVVDFINDHGGVK